MTFLKITCSLKAKVSNSLLFSVDSYQNKWGGGGGVLKFEVNNIN